MTRAAVYLRISQDATGEAAGVTRQREDCTALVESQGWTLHETYVDNDISASTGKARPGYKQMLHDIALGHIDAVVAWHPDRLYRKLADLEGLIASAEKHNIIMRTVRAGEIDLSTPTGRMLARILSATAQAEGEVKADRWKRSWRQGREAGQFARTGTRTWGYTRDGQIIEHEAQIARTMARMLLDGTPLTEIAWWLEREGITTTRDNPWSIHGVKRYLTNPVIAGYATLNGDIVGEGSWPALVEREQWEEIRAMISARTRAYKPRVSLLNGLLFCGTCKHRMITASSGPNRRTYRCPKRPDMNGCGSVSGKASAIEDVVEGYAQARLADPRVRQRIATLRAQPSGTQAELASLELRATELEHQLDEPGVPVATILRAIDRTKARQAELLADLAARNLAPLPVETDDWPTDLERRRALVDLVVARVELAKSENGGPRFDPARVKIEGR